MLLHLGGPESPFKKYVYLSGENKWKKEESGKGRREEEKKEKRDAGTEAQP